MTTATTEKTTTNRCDVSKVKVGSQFSRHSMGEVTAMESRFGGGKMFKLRNSEGFEWTIDQSILEKEFCFADQHDNEKPEKVSRTALIEVLKEHPHTAMTVCFHKKVDHKEVAKTLTEGRGDKSDRAWTKMVKDAIAGEETVIVGYHMGNFDEHQRLRFIKIGGNSAKTEFRLVDTRTLQWVIVARKKYEVK